MHKLGDVVLTAVAIKKVEKNIVKEMVESWLLGLVTGEITQIKTCQDSDGTHTTYTVKQYLDGGSKIIEVDEHMVWTDKVQMIGDINGTVYNTISPDVVKEYLEIVDDYPYITKYKKDVDIETALRLVKQKRKDIAQVRKLWSEKN